MTDIFKIEKVISNLPNTLTANTIYIVRRGTGFDMYVTDITGEIAHKQNESGIEELKTRKLNFENILYFPDTYPLSMETSTQGQIQTLTQFAEYGVDDFLRPKFANKYIKNNTTYKFFFRLEYTKGENTDNDLFEFGILNSTDYSFIKFTDINLNSTETGVHDYIINYNNNFMDSYELLFEFKGDANSTSKINILNICAYEIDSNTNQYDLYDHDFIISMSSLYGKVAGLEKNFIDIANRIDSISDKFNNVGVNLLYTEFTNPNTFNDYTQYIIEPNYTIEASTIRNEINTWKFAVKSGTSEEIVYLNQNGSGKLADTQNIYLDDNAYIFSFYGKISRGSHAIKVEFIDSFGNIALNKTFTLGISPQRFDYIFKLSRGKYTIKYTLNPNQTLQSDENIFIEQLMLEACLNPDSIFSENPQVKPSTYVDGYGINNAVISSFAKLNKQNDIFKEQMAESLLPDVYNPYSKNWSLNLYDYQDESFETRIPTYSMILEARTFPSQSEYPDALNIPLSGTKRLHCLRVFIGGGSPKTIEISNLVTNGPVNILLDQKSVFSTVESGSYNVPIDLEAAKIHMLDILTYSDGIRYSNRITDQVNVFSGLFQEYKVFPTVTDNTLRIEKLERIWTQVSVIGTVSDDIQILPFGAYNGLEVSVLDGVLYLRGAFKVRSNENIVQTMTPLFTITNVNYKPTSLGVGRFLSISTHAIDSSQTISFGLVFDANNNCIFTPFAETNGDIWPEKKEITYVFNCVAIGNIQPETGA